MRTDGLSKYQVRFCQEYVSAGLGNATQAYLLCYPKAKHNSAGANASRLLKKDRIQAYIQSLVEALPPSQSVNVDYVIGGLKKLAESANVESNKVRAYELLGRYLKIFQDTAITNTILTAQDYAEIRQAVKSKAGVKPAELEKPVNTDKPYAQNFALEAQG